MSSNDPSQTIPAVDAMRQDWAIVAPLMGGTKAMRAAGKSITEQWPDEDDESYRLRVGRSVLLPAYAETINNNTSRVFADPLQLGDDVPEAIAELCADVDMGGNDINTFCVDWFRTALSDGLCHVMIDYPQAGELQTLADEQAVGVRPYAVRINPERVLGWRSEGGKLTQFRFTESVEVPDGEFGVAAVQQIRVLEPGLWRTYRRPEKGGQWAIYDEGQTSLGYVPVVTFYTGRTGFMTARPPLLELAHLNVKHWNEQSDQDKAVRFARIRLAAIIGVDEDVMSRIKISSDCMLTLPRDADIKVVQGSAESVEVGQSSLDKIVEQMRMAGAKLLQKDKQQTKTAAQANEEAAQELSPLARMASQFADRIAQMLQIFADYRGLPDGGAVEMRGNFEQDFAPETTLPLLLNMASAGKLSDETLFAEMQRRSVISDEYNWQEEQERIASQGPALGVI